MMEWGETRQAEELIVVPPRGEIPAHAQAPHLKPRELEVLDRFSRGMSYQQIAEDMHLSHTTIRNNAMSLFRALGAQSQAHAVRIGFELGLLAREPSDDEKLE